MERERLTIPLRRFRQLAIVTAAGLCLLVVAGGIVRLTGSGLGCDDWPSCNEERFVDVSSMHTAIEQVNRLLSAAIGVPTVAMVIGAIRVRPARAGLLGPSVGVLLSVLANGVVGGLAVRGDLHPALVQSHFLLAMISIMFAMVAVHRSNPAPVAGEPVSTRRRIHFLAVGVLTAIALVTGTVVTGTGPHAGDEEARRWGFDISRVALIHSATVWLAVAAFLALVWWVRQDPRRRSEHESRMSTWIFLALVQGGIGYVQYLNGVPEVLVGAHLAGATALWVATVHLVQMGVAPLQSTGPEVHTAETGDHQGMSVTPAPRA